MWYVHKPTKRDFSGDPSQCPWPVAECITYSKLQKPPADILSVAPEYRVIEGDIVRVATAAERAAIDAATAAEQAAQAAAALAARKADAKTRHQSSLVEVSDIMLRAFARLVTKRTNLLAQKHNDLLTWLGAQPTLGKRTELPAMVVPVLTAAEVRTALESEIDRLNGNGA